MKMKTNMAMRKMTTMKTFSPELKVALLVAMKMEKMSSTMKNTVKKERTTSTTMRKRTTTLMPETLERETNEIESSIITANN